MTVAPRSPEAPGRPEILLVEDNEADATLFMELAEEGGWGVSFRWVSDGQQALDVMLRRGADDDARAPDLVVLDLGLPVLSGLEVLRRLRDCDRARPVPVVVLTTSARHEDRRESLRLGARLFLTKPSCLDDYDAVLRQIRGEIAGRGPER